MSLSAIQHAAIQRWHDTLSAGNVTPTACVIALNGRTVERRAWSTADALLSALDSVASLGGGVRTYQILALGLRDDDELARIEVRIDPKALAAASDERQSADARNITAAAAAITATDHKSVGVAIKATSDALGESHNALIGMMSAFGRAGGELLKSHADAVKSIDARAARAEARVSELEDRESKLRKENDELRELLTEAVKTAETERQNSKDVTEMLRGAFGPRVDELVKGFAMRAIAMHGPQPTDPTPPTNTPGTNGVAS